MAMLNNQMVSVIIINYHLKLQFLWAKGFVRRAGKCRKTQHSSVAKVRESRNCRRQDPTFAS